MFRSDENASGNVAPSSGLAPWVFVVGGLAMYAILIGRGRGLNAAIGDVSEGKLVYAQRCAVCHGVDGAGDGPAAAILDPRPRNFRAGKYRLVSTSNGVPSEADLARSIRNGMPGTSMPAWRQLSAGQTKAVADYIMGFTRDAITQQLTAKKLKPAVIESIVKSKTTPGKAIVVPPEPAVTAAELEKGRVLFEANCARCHTSEGRGKADISFKTDEGFPIISRDFTSNTFKGGSRGSDLFTRISTGIPGTPMSSFGSLPGEDVWRLVHYVQAFGGKPAPVKEK